MQGKIETINYKGQPIGKEECKHPPKRQYSWLCEDEHGNKLMEVGCCDCGKMREILLKKKGKK